MKFQLAQVNVARMLGVSLEDPIMKEFFDNLDDVNKLAENSSGFIWRYEPDNEAYETPLKDPQVIINISVWEDVESLEEFTYRTFHSSFIRRKKEWFSKYGTAHYAMWWIEEGKFPSVDECLKRLEHLQENGVSEYAFNFKKRFSVPESLD